MTAAPWGLLVYDIKILSTRQGVDWWLTFRAHHEPSGRITPVPGTATPQGDLAWVRCGDPDGDGSDSQEHAEWLRGHMLDQGVPKGAVAVRRLTPQLASKINGGVS